MTGLALVLDWYFIKKYALKTMGYRNDPQAYSAFQQMFQSGQNHFQIDVCQSYSQQ